MSKYKLEIYGWSIESTGHSITDEQINKIQDLIKLKECDELWEVRFDIEDEGIIQDLYNPDLWHISKALDNDRICFIITDENDEKILTFNNQDINDFYEVLGDTADDIPYEGYLSIPGEGDKSNVNNILITVDVNKGGVCEFELFESDTLPTAKDFCYQSGNIETPDYDWDFVSKVFFKGIELNVKEHLDSNGKSSTVEIYRKQNSTIV